MHFTHKPTSGWCNSLASTIGSEVFHRTEEPVDKTDVERKCQQINNKAAKDVAKALRVYSRGERAKDIGIKSKRGVRENI